MMRYNMMVCTLDTVDTKIDNDLNSFFQLFFETFPSLNKIAENEINKGCVVYVIDVTAGVFELETFFYQKEVRRFAQASLV